MDEIRTKSDLFVQSDIAMYKMHLLLALQSHEVLGGRSAEVWI